MPIVPTTGGSTFNGINISDLHGEKFTVCEKMLDHVARLWYYGGVYKMLFRYLKKFAFYCHSPGFYKSITFGWSERIKVRL